MIDTVTNSAPLPSRKPIPTRKPSAKTLARSLAAYLKANNIPGTQTVSDLMANLKSSIVAEEVGVSLDEWDS